MGGADVHNHKTLVGLDVHAKTTVAVLELDSGELGFRRIGGPPRSGDNYCRSCRARHRLARFLVRREVEFAGPGGSWTEAHHRWLRSLEFADRASRSVSEDYLARVVFLEQRRARLGSEIEIAAPAQPVGGDDRQPPVPARGQHDNRLRTVLRDEGLSSF
jgi:hypothetical protein